MNPTHPYRDTLTPLIADAQRELERLRQQRVALEARYEWALSTLEVKVAQTSAGVLHAAPPPDVMNGRDRQTALVFTAGLLSGLFLV